MTGSIVRLERAEKSFPLPEGGTITALRSIDLEVARNEFLTLLGPSGCGKTTLLHSISGFVELDGGRIVLDGEDVTVTPPHRRPVNTVFQNYALFPHMSVGDNVGYALDIARTARTERDRRVAAALEMVGLAGLQNRVPRQLSGGQQQRVALARAIIARPKLLLLDEPLSALDRNLRQSMQIELKTLQSELGISFIFVTHDQEEALTMSDRVAVLEGGSIRQIDAPRVVYDRPADAFVASFVGASNLFEGTLRRDGDRVTVATGDGDVIAADGAATFAEGEAVTALVRPEQFSIGAGAAAADRAALDVTVEQIVFIGSGFEIHARTQGGRKVTASVAGSSRNLVAESDAGRAMRLAYDPSAVHLIHRAEAAR